MMNTDRLMVWVGLAQDTGSPVEGEPSREAVSVLCDGAEAYLRAGGEVTPDLWSSLSELSRAAFVAAGNLIWKERAADIGMATRSDFAALAMTDPDCALDLVATAAVDATVARMTKKSEEAKA